MGLQGNRPPGLGLTDINRAGLIDGLDIEGFIECLFGICRRRGASAVIREHEEARIENPLVVL